jgi:fumarate reductase flavoprotein subunit
VTADVVVLGGGPAGMVAAVSAAEAGAKTIMLEKYEESAAPGGGGSAINTRDQIERGVTTDVEALLEDLLMASEGRADPKLLRKWADNSGPVMDWLIEIANAQGVAVSQMMGPYGYSFGMVDFVTGVSPDFYRMMTSRGLSLGFEARYSTQAMQLVRPNNEGRVTGAIAKNADGSYSQFNAKKAVVICTGDYGSNPEMMEKYAPWAAHSLPNLYFSGTNTGDGLQMALWVGALINEPPHCAMIHFNSTNAEPPVAGRPLGMGEGASQYLNVNKLGERFANEGMPFEYLALTVLRQPDRTQWQVFDAKSITEDVGAAVAAAVETGEVLTADTIEALAPKFGADPATFKATVDRYNELVQMGQDPDYGKSPELLGVTIDTAPFYVCESPPDLLVCMGGPVVNTEAQVLDTSFDAIPGLYAAGNVTGGFWGDTYPLGVFSGIARGVATVFGRIAGQNAAAEQV